MVATPQTPVHSLLMPSSQLFRSLGKQHHAYKILSKTKMCLKAEFSVSQGDVSGDVALSYATYPDQEHNVDPKKKPLIFLHGLFGAKGNLHSVSKYLADDGRKVITYDARNHGDSQHSAEMNFRCMTDDLIGLMQDLKLTDPVVMGHSMGGKTAMTLALEKPDKLSALIVLDVSPGKSPGVEELRKFAETMRQVKIPLGTSLPQARQLADAHLSPVVTNEGIRRFLLTNLRQFEGGEIRWRNNLDAFLENYSEIENFPVLVAKPFLKPTLFIFGENSAHYRELDESKIRVFFPEAEISVLKDAGHFVHAEKPLELVKIVKQFLQAVNGGSS
ncbi:unnamed protein product [Candidula unifasciata]|uniref:sn-1-specific diacylglycerol lipase ABHD11 n=1 Tax=Candidula unifasciata TaxID=100452 RepID=A0A8S3YQ98_9EUPU|nr:unnamed protein product [Candidula unifasciata]